MDPTRIGRAAWRRRGQAVRLRRQYQMPPPAPASTTTATTTTIQPELLPLSELDDADLVAFATVAPEASVEAESPFEELFELAPLPDLDFVPDDPPVDFVVVGAVVVAVVVAVVPDVAPGPSLTPAFGTVGSVIRGRVVVVGGLDTTVTVPPPPPGCVVGGSAHAAPAPRATIVSVANPRLATNIRR
jgi:hypothetical protein